ncbi:polymorphic toxin type 44 domain-containing protein [Flaviaesturariibacter amylovorans]|uniref:Bacterial toxin 44 domain-containing protein n=1 Tax=Flaviaesturariibacter amylovorans TaxID=1084520 RepID=A0ABP8GBY6_9BACT
MSYDANGNILEYKRNGVAAKPGMDNLIYKYPQVLDLATNKAKLVSNRLRYVYDAVGANEYNITPAGHGTEDIDSQTPEMDANVVRAEVKTFQPATDNYDYDRIGNLIRDRQSKLDHIYWTVYGKIDRIVKAPALNTEIAYDYDAAGNRIGKKVTVNGVSTYTFYVRDAQGNTLGIYTKTGNGPVQWGEQMLYGSSRLGTIHLNVPVPATPMVPVGTATLHDGFEYVRKTYELSNHLGNVLATVSDQKRGVDPGADGTSDYYIADVATANDYYPFGMQMPGRKLYTESEYRYGFGGHEKTDEVKGEGNSYTAQFWEYDPRIVTRWNQDPVVKHGQSAYSILARNPIWFIDPNGADSTLYNSSTGGLIARGVTPALDKTAIWTVDPSAKGFDKNNPWKTAQKLTYTVGGDTKEKGIRGTLLRGNHPLAGKGWKAGDQVYEEDLLDMNVEFNTVVQQWKPFFAQKGKRWDEQIKMMEKCWYCDADQVLKMNAGKKAAFVWMVGPNMPFDLKSQTRKNLQQIQSFAAVIIGQYSFYRGRLMNYDDYGNAAFGAWGKAYGYGLPELTSGADIDQIFHTGKSDPGRDQFFIKYGFVLFK